VTRCAAESREERNWGNLVNLWFVSTLESNLSNMWPALFRLWLFGSWVLCAEVGSKLFITLAFVLLLHFIERGASERIRRLKLPVTLGATEAQEIVALNPFQFAWHLCMIAERCAKQYSGTLLTCKDSLSDARVITSVPATEARRGSSGAYGCKLTCFSVKRLVERVPSRVLF
jgi:hypothetical protein